MLVGTQKQIVLGTLLGNGRLERDATGVYLVMKSRNKDWIGCKAKYLRSYERDSWRNGKTYYWVSQADEVFRELNQLCYVECQKTASVKWLMQLDRIGYMTWYCDVGCLVGRGRRNACLRTPSLSNVKHAAEFTNTKLAALLEGEQACKMTKTGKQSKENKAIVFTHGGTSALMHLIADVMPVSMHHLIPRYR